MNPLSVEAYLTGMNFLSSLNPVPIASIPRHEHYVFCFKANKKNNIWLKKQKLEISLTAICFPLVNIGVPSLVLAARSSSDKCIQTHRPLLK